jgi:hypothetical protein
MTGVKLAQELVDIVKTWIRSMDFALTVGEWQWCGLGSKF